MSERLTEERLNQIRILAARRPSALRDLLRYADALRLERDQLQTQLNAQTMRLIEEQDCHKETELELDRAVADSQRLDWAGNNMTLPPLKITLSRTADGLHDYLQILTADQFSLNIVLISNSIEVKDVRPK